MSSWIWELSVGKRFRTGRDQVPAPLGLPKSRLLGALFRSSDPSLARGCFFRGFAIARSCCYCPRANMSHALQPPDNHHLNAAEGWLGLGNSEEAGRELEKLSLAVLSHPEVLRVKYHYFERTKDWERAAETAQLLC